VILILGYDFPYVLSGSYLLVPVGFIPHGFFSADYYGLIPWIGYYIFGFGLARYILHKDKFLLFTPTTPLFLEPFRIIGKHALLIYMLHIPLIYGVIYFFTSSNPS
jgi:uncharacterized membrane protein